MPAPSGIGSACSAYLGCLCCVNPVVALGIGKGRYDFSFFAPSRMEQGDYYDKLPLFQCSKSDMKYHSYNFKKTLDFLYILWYYKYAPPAWRAVHPRCTNVHERKTTAMPKKIKKNPVIIPKSESDEAKVNKFKSRTLLLMLYPDNPDHAKAVNEIREADIAYAIVLHDRDVWSADDEIENPEHKAGDLKKVHWHIVLRFSNPCWNTSVCTRFGIEERFCKKAESCDEALEYLIHKNHPDKFQYHVDDVTGDLASRLTMLIGKDGKTEGEQVLEILEYLDTFERSVSVTELVRWACQSGHYGYLRQGGSLLMRVLDEHNTRFISGRTDYKVECAQAGFRAFVDGYEACRKKSAYD